MGVKFLSDPLHLNNNGEGPTQRGKEANHHIDLSHLVRVG